MPTHILGALDRKPPESSMLLHSFSLCFFNGLLVTLLSRHPPNQGPLGNTGPPEQASLSLPPLTARPEAYLMRCLRAGIALIVTSLFFSVLSRSQTGVPLLLAHTVAEDTD